MKNKELFTNNKIVFVTLFSFLCGFLYCFPGLHSGSSAGFIYRGILLLIAFVYIGICVDFKKLIQNRLLIIVVSIFLIASTISLSSLSLKTSKSLSNTQLLQSIGQIPSIIISLIIFFDLFDSKNSRLSLQISYLLINFFAVFCILYSLISDRISIYNLFTKFDHSNYDIVSIFVDKNTFGLCLFIASCSNLILLAKRNINQFTIATILIFVYFLYSILIRAKSSSLVIFPLLIFSVVLMFKQLYFYSKKCFIVVASVIFSVSTLLILLTLTKIWVFSYLFSALFDQYGLFYDAKIVLQSRFINWNYLLSASSHPLVILIGWGERIPRYIFTSPVDNAYIYIFLNGGLLKIVIYASIIFVLSKKITNGKMRYFICLASLLIYGLFQDYYLLGLSYSSISFWICVFFSKTNSEAYLQRSCIQK